MGIKNKINEDYLHFLTMTVVDWVDIFTRERYREIVLDAFIYCQENKGLELYAWCIMSNHIHLIAGAKENNKLSDILRDFKKFTNKKIINAIKEEPESRRIWLLDRFQFAAKWDKKILHYKFWREGNEAKELYSHPFIIQKLNYIHNNPVRAGIVDRPEDYRYSSARDYTGEKGLLDIIFID